MLFCIRPLETNDKEQVRVILDITVYKEGFRSEGQGGIHSGYTLSPLTMIHPATDEVFIEEETCRIVFSVEPGSQVFINDNNYSDLVDSEGLFEKEFQVPDNPKTYMKYV